MDQPKWLAEAWGYLAVSERPGAASDPQIRAFYETVGHAEISDDSVPWCAAFVGACLERSGVGSTRSLLARSYLDWGEPKDAARFGSIAVLSRGTDTGAGHVGFVVGETDTNLVLLGGNQSDEVSVAAFPKSRLLGVRWPATRPAEMPDEAIKWDIFGVSLEHVLEMEGGYTDDPYDPGGPTNKGITLAEFARYRGGRLTDDNRADLVAALKAIAPDAVRAIYLRGYWQPSRAGEMPAPIALMHFDAAVNHGLAGSAELLQAAAAVAVDGEIGPITMAAVKAADPYALVERYAECRRQRYRALPHFWRFGRGWLNRVDRTLAAACALPVADATISAAAPPSSTSPSAEKGSNMTTISTAPTGKFWGQSVTIWGAAITALSTVVPILGPAIGVDLTPDLVREAGEQIVGVVQALGGLVGTLMTIYGRVRATTVLTSSISP